MNRVTARAPGRINLIGEHTDYNNGYALPIALTQQTTVHFDPDGSNTVTLSSEQEGAGTSFDIGAQPGDVGGWSAYPAGSLWALASAGYPVLGGTMTVNSQVPIGAGLASSAALECAVLLAMNAATGTRLNRLDLARIAQSGENDFVGASTGLMDQIASLYGEVDRALLIDCESLEVTSVGFDLEASGLSLVVINSHATHSHSTGEYASRRETCSRAAHALGIDSLRRLQDANIEQTLTRVEDGTDRRRVRHVLTENRRVLDCAAALSAGEFRSVGEFMNRSHASMRDDFEITTPLIDLIAESAVRYGALGARMTGGGFGGCVIALVGSDDAYRVADGVCADVVRAGHRAPTWFVAHPGPGATTSPVSG
ncbi:MAG: galactokinase [Rhodococcus sp.]|nr:galactokinase [Rhodococcus sp. (in: high G+C Gram-positive bacteria)]